MLLNGYEESAGFCTRQDRLILIDLVGEAGLEPAHPFEYRHLKPARLPFRHSP